MQTETEIRLNLKRRNEITITNRSSARKNIMEEQRGQSMLCAFDVERIDIVSGDSENQPAESLRDVKEGLCSARRLPGQIP